MLNVQNSVCSIRVLLFAVPDDSDDRLSTLENYREERRLDGSRDYSQFREGGRFASIANYTNATPYFSAWNLWSGLVKLPASLPVQAFAVYTFNKHWAAKLSCLNILNKYYAEGYSGLIQGSQGLPRTVGLEIDYKR